MVNRIQLILLVDSGVVQIFTNRAIRGIAECEQALELDRNLAQAHGWIGLDKCFSGRAGETEDHNIQEAFRLSPRDSRTFERMAQLGVAKSRGRGLSGGYMSELESVRYRYQLLKLIFVRRIEHRRDARLPSLVSGLLETSTRSSWSKVFQASADRAITTRKLRLESAELPMR